MRYFDPLSKMEDSKLLTLMLLSAIAVGQCYSGNMHMKVCPGRYCGRIVQGNTSQEVGECGACPRGSRSDGTFCVKCSNSLSMYDWLYLGFMFLTVLVLHWFFIDYFSKRSKKVIVILFICAAIETLCAAIVTLLLNEPKGSLNLISCKSEQLSDWYTVFFNPKPDYVNTIYCTNEAVYPLYTIVLTFFAMSVALLLLVRPISSHYICADQGISSIYAALYFLPILATVHALFGGLLYYTYPYIIVVSAILSNATVLARNRIMGFRQLLSSKRHIGIVLGHWTLLAYGFLGLTQLAQPAIHGPMFILVTAPVLFYLATSSLTDPIKFKR
ncbi:JNK1/MAPK8-associated membrane protein isoform X2 [Exaiptasia diaphana]|uniref:JNK1/MAPK8-associated membrane protein n=1 Tax=Exaiptasia diaphana TaxID=2652724 RepID=A0A913XJF1_EXADI|nr:JNK1/MAPK8-associated membrane protein isoform X1 [Exaiptasia diaphana]XP_028516149.1 JNK1/MAPK8-associated membrane protein isoform X2 [Exaiptasia diaphana]KXJ25883.1 JNK1/MAPK8-associated membrane protein [Exaiptasia diaphana]